MARTQPQIPHPAKKRKLQRNATVACLDGSRQKPGRVPEESPVLITFARPEESRAFRRRHALRPAPDDARYLEGRAGCMRITVRHTGIGPHTAAVVMEEALERATWSRVIAAGFAGGLDPVLNLGDTVLDDPARGQRIVSRTLPAETVAAKAQIRRETGASAVDMETETIWNACRRAGLSLVAARVISDTARDDLPVPFTVWFNVSAQRARPLALLAHLGRHPHKIRPFARFVRALPRLSEALAVAVEGCIGPE